MAHLKSRRREDPPARTNTSLTTSLVVLLVSSLFCGCSKSRTAPTESAPTTQPQQSSATVKSAETADSTEVNQAIARVFKGAAQLDLQAQPNFFCGDFNGDSSADIAVIVRPASEKIAELNQEYPPWILKDPFSVGQPAPPRITEQEVMLAVIHGYGPSGWRDPQATQTYLLKNAVGPDLKAYTKSDFLNANAGKNVPGLAGDLLAETLRNAAGYLYFTGAQYSWYDPKTFKGEVAARLTHRGM